MQQVSGSGGAGSIFNVVMIKPTHYDDEGYPIQWFRSAIPSNTLACLNGLAEDAATRQVLGPDVEIRLHTFDETNTRVRPERIIRMIEKAGGRGLVASWACSRTSFRARSISPSRSGPPACRSASAASTSRAASPCCRNCPPRSVPPRTLAFRCSPAKPRTGRLDEVLRDAYAGKMAPLYNHMDDLPALDGEPLPILPRTKVRRTTGTFSSLDLGRGCPYQCSFCTIINVQGRKSRFRTADDLERILRQNYAQGVKRFFITDDNFARNKDWEAFFDRIIKLREEEGMVLGFTIQVDTLVPQDPELHREGDARRRRPRLHRAREHQSREPDRGQEAAEQDHRIPGHDAEMARPWCADLRGLHPGLSGRHQGKHPARCRDHQARVAARPAGILLPDAAPRLRRPQESAGQGRLDGSGPQQIRSQPPRLASRQDVGFRMGGGLSGRLGVLLQSRSHQDDTAARRRQPACAT